MFQTPRIHISWYVFADWLAALLGWTSFYLGRRLLLGETESLFRQTLDANFFLGIFFIPLAGWYCITFLEPIKTCTANPGSRN
jgi:hypothetical protein